MTDHRRQHHTLERRRNAQRSNLKSLGKDPDRSKEMLEFYLQGVPAPEIAEAYGVSQGNVYRIICKEALFQLMEQRSVDRLEEMEELL